MILFHCKTFSSSELVGLNKLPAKYTVENTIMKLNLFCYFSGIEGTYLIYNSKQFWKMSNHLQLRYYNMILNSQCEKHKDLQTR